VEAKESGMLPIPKKLVSEDQAWFWSREWQEKEREADQAIEPNPFKRRRNCLSIWGKADGDPDHQAFRQRLPGFAPSIQEQTDKQLTLFFKQPSSSIPQY
jgi:hypothetical protein